MITIVPMVMVIHFRPIGAILSGTLGQGLWIRLYVLFHSLAACITAVEHHGKEVWEEA